MRPRTLALLLLAVFVGLGIGAAARTSPASPAAAPDDEFALWLPPGEYHSIVIATTGTERVWWVSLQDARGVYPVTLPAGETTTLNFPGGLSVTPDSKTRLVSRFVPWGEYAEFHPLQGGNVRLFGWAVSAAGEPVMLLPDPQDPRRRK